MSNDKAKPADTRAKSGADRSSGKAAQPKPAGKPPVTKAPVAPVPNPVVAPLFRRVDWLTLAIVFLLVFTGYFLTLAPDLTLEDSGELAVGSYYAAVPHPPGYPVWSIYSWLFTELIPYSNIAFRVGISSAFAGAMSCGLLGLLVSRGSSMILESLPEFKDLDKRIESATCLVSGFVAGLLMGFNGFMWSQSVIVEVYTFGVLSLMTVLCLLLRWMYAPHQRKFLYWSFCIFGICFTNHQTLVVAAMGLEVGVLYADRKLGRDLFFGNSIVFVLGLIAKQLGYIGMFDNNGPLFAVYIGIGLGSMVVCAWQTIKTQKLFTEWKTVLILLAMWLLGAGLYFYEPITSMTNPPMNWGYARTVDGFIHALTRGQYDKANPTDILKDPKRFIDQLGKLKDGVVEEFTPVCTLIALIPLFYLRKVARRERAWLAGLLAIYFCLGIILLILLNPSPDRQSLQLNKVFFTASHLVISMYVGYGLTLITALMATQYARCRRLMLAGGAIASAICLYTLVVIYSPDTSLPTEPDNIFSSFLNLVTLSISPSQDAILRFSALLGVILAGVWTVLVLLQREKFFMTLSLGLIALLPAQPILNHWSDNEQRGHLFGFWFGHDMFTPPFNLYPQMARNAVLFGGTDPGRFCPTYMIFDESFIPPSCRRDPAFDRRDVYIITQNALADNTYLDYIRAHYNRSAQKDPPFFQELFRPNSERTNFYNPTTNIVARLASPLDTLFGTWWGNKIEKRRRAGSSYFQPEHFTDLPALAARLKNPAADDAVSRYVVSHLSAETKSLLSATGNDSALRKALATDLNQLLEDDLAARQKLEKDQVTVNAATAEKAGLLYTPERFAKVPLSEDVQLFLKQDPRSFTRIRLDRQLLEAAYPKEISRSPGGVYPDREILTPSAEDNQQAFNDYFRDVEKRLKHDKNFPNEPRQMRPGEEVHVENNHMSVSGQTAVMAINGNITKIIFDKNPDHEFYVEESFPLDWMYPYLSPYGIIMKINREPMRSLDEQVLSKDRAFWKQFSARLIGDWITPETPVKDICDFTVRVYKERNYAGFTGDRKFIRDDDAQKAYSKLRSAIAGLYNWRINNVALQLQEIYKKPPAERAKLAAEERRLAVEQQHLIVEAEFAYKQAFAFCPYSPEALYRYVNLLLVMAQNDPRRADDALLLTETALKHDPANVGIQNMLQQMRAMRPQQPEGAGQSPSNAKPAQPAPGQAAAKPQPPQPVTLSDMEAEYHANPMKLDNAMRLSSAYWMQKHTNEALAILDGLLASPQADLSVVATVAQAYQQVNQIERLQKALEKLVQLTPESPEAWYDLSTIRANQHQDSGALEALAKAISLSNARQKKEPSANNLHAMAEKEPRFDHLRTHLEYQKIMKNP